MTNSEIADLLEEIADLLQMQDENRFRIRSYRNAAQSIRSQSKSLEAMANEDADLSSLPNVGESISEKIRTILNTGTCEQLERLRKKLPSGITDLLKVPGIGPKKAKMLYRQLGIHSMEELEAACIEGSVSELDGMGEKTESQILKGIKTVRKTSGRILYSTAAAQLHALSDYLKSISDLSRI